MKRNLLIKCDDNGFKNDACFFKSFKSCAQINQQGLRHKAYFTQKEQTVAAHDPETELARTHITRDAYKARSRQLPPAILGPAPFSHSVIYPLIICLFSGLGCDSCSKETPEEEPDAGKAVRMARFEDESIGLEISLSDHWTVSVAANQPKSTILDARYISPNEGQLVRPRLLASKQTLPPGAKKALDEILERSIEATKRSLASTKVKVRRISTKSWRIDGVDVSSFELSYVITKPATERQVEVTQKSLLAIREDGNSIPYALEINATYVENDGAVLGSEIETVFRSLKFSPVKKNDDP